MSATNGEVGASERPNLAWSCAGAVRRGTERVEIGLCVSVSRAGKQLTAAPHPSLSKAVPYGHLMDGYSVSEAASVLGVPIERVWELLARGILSGAPEGETGMRVFLQPRPAPQATAEPPAPRGNGTGEPERELSPFRELLTEFRNLTERYGQALLALGESRGEVAALRSRVDLLEARMDLGLPAPSAPSRPRGWWPGAGPYPADESLVPAEPPQVSAPAPEAAEPEPTEEPHEADEHRARPRGPRRATESFAEAIARAQDPSLPDLPDEPIPQPVHGDSPEPATHAGLPHELPAADMPRAEEVLREKAPSEPASSEEAEPIAEPELEPDPEPEPEPAPEPEPDPAQAGIQPEEAPPLAASEPLEWDAERYTATIDEPDWFEAEADEPATAAEPPPSDEVEPATAAEPPPSEVEAPAAADEPEEALPGAGDLQAALEALGVPRDDESRAVAEPATDEATAPAPALAPEPGPSVAASSPIPESALRYRPVAPAGPTGRAYRRLRRIFPS